MYWTKSWTKTGWTKAGRTLIYRYIYRQSGRDAMFYFLQLLRNALNLCNELHRSYGVGKLCNSPEIYIYYSLHTDQCPLMVIIKVRNYYYCYYSSKLHLVWRMWSFYWFQTKTINFISLNYSSVYSKNLVIDFT